MEDYGLFKKVLRRGESSVTLDPRVLERCRAVEQEPLPLDMWTVDHRNILLVDCGRLLGPLAYLSKTPDQPRFQEVLSALTRHPYGKIGALEGLAERGDPNELLRWVDEAERLLDEDAAKQARGRLLFIRGFVENRKGATSDAIDSFRRSIDVFPDTRNSSVLGLLTLYAAQRRTGEYQKLREAMYPGRGAPAAVLELDRSIGK
jgi:tetratricopeptide (TPR) repeat protein